MNSAVSLTQCQIFIPLNENNSSKILQVTTTSVTAKARNEVQTFENLHELKLCEKQNTSLLLLHSTEANLLKNKNK